MKDQKVNRYVRVFSNLLKLAKFEQEIEQKDHSVVIYLYNVNGLESEKRVRAVFVQAGFKPQVGKDNFYEKDGVVLSTTFMSNIGCANLTFSKDNRK